MPSKIRGEGSFQRLAMIGREEANLHVIIDDPLQRHPPRRDAQRVTDLLGDDHLALLSYDMRHGDYSALSRLMSALACGHAFSIRAGSTLASNSNEIRPFSYRFVHPCCVARPGPRLVAG